MLAPSVYIGYDEGLGGPKCAIGECVFEYTASGCVFVAIDLAVSIGRPGASVDTAVPVGLLNVGFTGAVDFS